MSAPKISEICDAAWTALLPQIGGDTEQKDTFIGKCADNGGRALTLKKEEQCFLKFPDPNNAQQYEFMTVDEAAQCLQRLAVTEKWVTLQQGKTTEPSPIPPKTDTPPKAAEPPPALETTLVKNACDDFAQRTELLEPEHTDTIQAQRSALNAACVEKALELCPAPFGPRGNEALRKNCLDMADRLTPIHNRAKEILATQTEPEKQPESLPPDQDLTKTVPPIVTDFSAAFNRMRSAVSFGLGSTPISGLSVDGADPVTDFTSVNVRFAGALLFKPIELGHDSQGTSWAFRPNVGVGFEEQVNVHSDEGNFNIFGFAPRFVAEFVAQLSGWRMVVGPQVALYMGALTSETIDVGVEGKRYRAETPSFVGRFNLGVELGAEFPKLFSASEQFVPFVTIGGGFNVWFGEDDVTNTPIGREGMAIGPTRWTGDLHLDVGVNF